MNEENNKTMDFNIVTAVVNTISMKKIEDYLKSGSSDNPPGEAFQALDIVLKNRPFSLRLVNYGMHILHLILFVINLPTVECVFF